MSPQWCQVHINCVRLHNTSKTKTKIVLTYLLTYLWSWALPEKLPIVQPFRKFPAILRNPKVHHRVHKSPPLVPILSQFDPVHTIPSYLRSILILSTHLRIGLTNGLFPSGFPTNILHAFLISPFVLHALPISSSLTCSF
jgi:hypothetical protein